MAKTWGPQTREEVLYAVAEGLPRGEIAVRLGITVQNVKYHIESLYREAGLSGSGDRIKLMLWAMAKLKKRDGGLGPCGTDQAEKKLST